MGESDNYSDGTELWCDGCEDETPNRQVSPSTAPGPTYRCLVCAERIEVEAAVGGGRGGD